MFQSNRNFDFLDLKYGKEQQEQQFSRSVDPRFSRSKKNLRKCLVQSAKLIKRGDFFPRNRGGPAEKFDLDQTYMVS